MFERFPHYQFAVAAVNNLDAFLVSGVDGSRNVKLIFEDTYNLLLNSSAAIVTSGTATLETALFKVPQIVVYKANTLSYWLAKWLVSVPFISLVNLIAEKEVVKELIQSDANPDRLSQELTRILEDNSYLETIRKEYDQIIKKLDTGSASENTATLMIQYLSEDSHS